MMKITNTLAAVLLCILPSLQHVQATTNHVLSLRSSTDYFQVPDSNSLDLISSFTLEAWVNPSRTVNQDQAVISKPRRADGTGIELRTFGKGLGVGFNNAGINLVFGGGQTLELNTWHHIAATYDGTVAYVYIDGVPVGINKFSAKLLNSSAPLTIGQKNPPGGPLAGSFLGLIDEVRVWNRALTQAEIQLQMSLRLTGQEPGLVGYWNFDDKTAKDGGIYHNDGILVGGAQLIEVPAKIGEPIALSGWNADVVVENSGNPSSIGFDGGGSRWFEAGVGGHKDGLPASGEIINEIPETVRFQLQPFTENNCLRLPDALNSNSGTLVLSKPAKLSSLFVLAASTGGSGTGMLELDFVDGTKSPPFDFNASDWFGGTNQFTTGQQRFAITGLGRLEPSAGHLVYSDAGFGFGLHRSDFNLVALGLDFKQVRSITFTKPIGQSAPQFTGVFAVSGAKAFEPSNEPGSVPAPAGLIAWWTGDDTASDILGNRPGILRGGLSFGGGQVGNAFVFAGSGQYMEIQSRNIPPPWTAAVWLLRENAPGSSAAFITDPIYGLKIEQHGTPREVGLTHFGVADYSFGYVVRLGVWTHLVFVASAEKTDLWADGVLVGSLPISLPLPLAELGRRTDGSDPFKGHLDEAMVFDRALTDQEIQGMFAAGTAGLCRTAEFLSIEPLNTRQRLLTLKGLTGSYVTVHASENLTDWTPLITLPNPSGTLTLIDPVDRGSGQFYRATTP